MWRIFWAGLCPGSEGSQRADHHNCSGWNLQPLLPLPLQHSHSRRRQLIDWTCGISSRLGLTTQTVHLAVRWEQEFCFSCHVLFPPPPQVPGQVHVRPWHQGAPVISSLLRFCPACLQGVWERVQHPQTLHPDSSATSQTLCIWSSFSRVITVLVVWLPPVLTCDCLD